MIRTAEELKAQAKIKKITFYPVHECSMCGYMCGYVFANDWEAVGYDAGCDCTYGSQVEMRDWNSLAETYNMNQPERNPKIDQKFLDDLDKIWQFNL